MKTWTTPEAPFKWRPDQKAHILRSWGMSLLETEDMWESLKRTRRRKRRACQAERSHERATEPHHVCKGVEAEDSSPAGRSVEGMGWGGLGHWRTTCPAAGLSFYPNTQWKVFTKTLPPWRKRWQPHKGWEGENEELVSGVLGRQGCPTKPSGVMIMSHPFHQWGHRTPEM